MRYDKLLAVTNRKICYDKHFNKDFKSKDYNYILGSFPALNNISGEHKDACIVLVNQILSLVNLQIPAIILREKDLPKQDYEILARVAIYICKRSDTRLILHSFYDVAINLNHPDIHLPLHLLLELSNGKNKNKPDFFSNIGVSVHSIGDAKIAEKSGATYLTAGHIFDTDCKKGVPGRGIDFLREICQSVTLPVYAIGGITENNISRCIDAGAALACMMSGLM